MKHTKVKTLLLGEAVNETVCVKGWVRTKRGSKNVSFIAINDGSTINNIQAVADVPCIAFCILLCFRGQ